jgi:hypothetical protein
MQNSSNHKSASLDNTQENQTMSSKVGEGFVPTSMVQNILEWQSQALESKLKVFFGLFFIFCIKHKKILV